VTSLGRPGKDFSKCYALKKFAINIKDPLLRELGGSDPTYILHIVIVSMRDEFTTLSSHLVVTESTCVEDTRTPLSLQHILTRQNTHKSRQYNP